MKILKAIPIFGVVLVIYTGALAWFFYQNPGVDPMAIQIFSIRLPSHEIWMLQMSDAVIIIGLFVLFIEILKSTATSDMQIVEHVLSTFVFIFYIIAFLLAPMAANSTFLILGIMSLIDVIAGFTISISAARRDLTVG